MQKPVGIIGGGNMGEALIAGILQSGLLLPGEILFSEPRPERRESLLKKFGVSPVESNRDPLDRSSSSPQGEDLATAGDIFQAVGITEIVKESQMDAVTGLSGSGPAYVFAVIEALAAGGVKEGLSQDVALNLTTQTVLGAAHLIQTTAKHPATLRDQVCTPGGTTMAGLYAMEEGGFRLALMNAVIAATRRL